jgi:hypothetical protein
MYGTSVFSKPLIVKAFCYAAAFTLLLLCCACARQDKPVNAQASEAQAAAKTEDPGRADVQTSGAKSEGAPDGWRWAIELGPAPSTPSDDLKVVKKAEKEDPSGVMYKYAWRVNDRHIDNATGDSLSKTYFKRKDTVKVLVTRTYEGLPDDFRSASVRIAGGKPSLEITVLSSGKSEPVVMRLVGKDPEGGRLEYALEAPVPAGMEIDASSGTIKWNRPGDYFGVLPFKVAVVNSDGDRFVKAFELSVSDKPITVSGGRG